MLPNVVNDAGRVEYDELPEFGTKVVRIFITSHCPSEMRREILLGLRDIRYLNLVYDIVDLSGEEGLGRDDRMSSVDVPVKSKIPLVEALNLIRNLMKKGGYAYRRGKMSKMPKEAV